jgi:DNA-binding NarL/FixJ family response regulator
LDNHVHYQSSRESQNELTVLLSTTEGEPNLRDQLSKGAKDQVMNGLATQEIKRLYPDTAVLVVSANDDPDLPFASLECGADDFMPRANLQMLSFHLARLFPPQSLMD